MKLKLILTTLVLLLSPVISRAEVAPEKRIEIDRMLKLTGMEKLVDQMMSQMIAGFRTNKDVPNEFWDRFAKKVKGADMIEMIIPLYDKYYSLEDLRAVNAFYASPSGQRILSTMPQLMQESLSVGQQWGAKISQQAADEVQAELAAKKEAVGNGKAE